METPPNFIEGTFNVGDTVRLRAGENCPSLFEELDYIVIEVKTVPETSWHATGHRQQLVLGELNTPARGDYSGWWFIPKEA